MTSADMGRYLYSLKISTHTCIYEACLSSFLLSHYRKEICWLLLVKIGFSPSVVTYLRFLFFFNLKQINCKISASFQLKTNLCSHIVACYILLTMLSLRPLSCRVIAEKHFRILALKAHSLLPLYSYITLHISDRCWHRPAAQIEARLED